MPIATKLKVMVDRETCIGDGLCVEEAPGTFEMDDDRIAIVKDDPADDRDTIVEAACACPVDAITVFDGESGEKLCPEE